MVVSHGTNRAFGRKGRFQTMLAPIVRTLGLDVSDRFTSYCLLDGDGEILEEGKLRTSEVALRDRFDTYECRVIVEAGTHSPWISRLFAAFGQEVIVANPRKCA